MLYPFAYSSNASLLYLCKIIYNRPGVAVSQSPIIFAFCINGFTCRITAAFPCSLHGCYVCLLEFVKEIVVCLSHMFILVLFLGQSFWFSVKILCDAVYSTIPEPSVTERHHYGFYSVLFQEVEHFTIMVVYQYLVLVQ